MSEFYDLERKLERLEASAALLGRTEAIERDIAQIQTRLDEIETQAAEHWSMKRDVELGRVEADDGE